MLREFGDLMESLAAKRPWVIILEDLHWSDVATVDALSRIARRDRKAAILVLATYRPIDVAVGEHPVRTVHQDLQIHGRCTELALDRLARTEVEQYLALRFDSAELAKRIGGTRLCANRRTTAVRRLPCRSSHRATGDRRVRWKVATGIRGSDFARHMPRDLREMITRQIDRFDRRRARLARSRERGGRGVLGVSWSQGRWIATSWKSSRFARNWRGRAAWWPRPA